MACCRLNSQFEDQSPQSSSSGLPMEVIVSEEIPSPSGEGAGHEKGFLGVYTGEEGVQMSGRSSCIRCGRKEIFRKSETWGGEDRSWRHRKPGKQERRLGPEIQG